MKNTTFRKKALLSSVAMLLVAIVALGSATFAWFTANPTVTAEGFSAQASTAAGLAILSATEKTYYGDSPVWDYDTIINCKADAQETDASFAFAAPASYDYITNGASSFYTTTAAEEDDYEAEDITKATTTTAFYSENIYFKSTVAGHSATVARAKVTLTGTSDPMAATVRAMLKDQNGNVLGTWTIAGAGNKYITAGPTLSSDNFTATASGTYVNTNLTATSTGNDYVTLYVWIDGEDEACKTTNVTMLADILSNVAVELTTTPASA